MAVHHYRTVKCPHCGKKSDFNQTVGDQELYGCPFRVCPNCKATYFDSAYKEPGIALYEETGTDFHLSTIIWTIIFNIGAALALYWWIRDGNDNGNQWALLIIGAFAVLFDILFVKSIINRIHSEEHQQKQVDIIEGKRGKLNSEQRESIERLSNINYLDSLKAHGVNVPDYFYDRLINYTEIKPRNNM